MPCHNAVRLHLHALAYNLGNFMRTLAMPKTADDLRAYLDQLLAQAGQRPRLRLPDARPSRSFAMIGFA
jgi:hypothetical protein